MGIRRLVRGRSLVGGVVIALALATACSGDVTRGQPGTAGSAADPDRAGRDFGSSADAGDTGVSGGGTGATVGGAGATVGGTRSSVGGTRSSGGDAGGGRAGGGRAGAGAGGGSAGTGTTGGGTTGGGGSNGCPVGQQMIMGACGCPAFNPDYCPAVGKCVNFTKNPDHCAACGMACGATSACVASACTPDLGTVAEIADCGTLYLVSANTKLYALSSLTGQLLSVPATGAPISIATGLTGATAFAVDATSAYVANGMKVTKVALTGGTKLDLVSETQPIYDVTVDATSIYYAVDAPATSSTDVYAGFIKKASSSAATTPGMAVIVAAGMDLGQPRGVVVSGPNVLYVSDSAKNVEVQKGLPVGADPYTDPLHYKLGASQGSLLFGHRSVQTDGTYVYWANDSIQRSKFGDATPVQEQVAMSLGLTVAFALSPTTAYFGSDLGDFAKGAILSDTPTPLARKLDTITSIVVDASSVYVASGCKILKAPL